MNIVWVTSCYLQSQNDLKFILPCDYKPQTPLGNNNILNTPGARYFPKEK